jgi:hypothetical protein
MNTHYYSYLLVGKVKANIQIKYTNIKSNAIQHGEDYNNEEEIKIRHELKSRVYRARV